jgi:hypothetical protein
MRRDRWRIVAKMAAKTYKVDIGKLDRMSRQELIRRLLELAHPPLIEFSPGWLARQPTGRLRALFLMVQLYHVVRKHRDGSLEREKTPELRGL